jgi:hypothetical protein
MVCAEQRHNCRIFYFGPQPVERAPAYLPGKGPFLSSSETERIDEGGVTGSRPGSGKTRRFFSGLSCIKPVLPHQTIAFGKVALRTPVRVVNTVQHRRGGRRTDGIGCCIERGQSGIET